MTETKKWCQACGYSKPTEEFYMRRHTIGYETYCKKCYNKLSNKRYSAEEKQMIKEGKTIPKKIGIFKNKCINQRRF